MFNTPTDKALAAAAIASTHVAGISAGNVFYQCAPLNRSALKEDEIAKRNCEEAKVTTDRLFGLSIGFALGVNAFLLLKRIHK